MVVKWWGPRWRDRLPAIVLAVDFVAIEIVWSQRYRFTLIVAAIILIVFAERRARRLEREKAKAPVESADD